MVEAAIPKSGSSLIYEAISRTPIFYNCHMMHCMFYVINQLSCRGGVDRDEIIVYEIVSYFELQRSFRKRTNKALIRSIAEIAMYLSLSINLSCARLS
jgi:hypothetical protein